MNPNESLPNLSLVTELQLVHTDERRTIKDINLPQSNWNRIEVTSKTGPLGNHYHKEKTENFMVVAGGGRVIITRVDKDGHPVGDSKSDLLQEGSVIQIPPFHFHIFELEVGTILITYSDKPFNTKGVTNEEIDFWPLVPMNV